MIYDVILDCYTDEPSGLGVPPYLGVHSRYIAGCLQKKNKKYYYITIDDLRANNGEVNTEDTYNKRIINTTKNVSNIKQIMKNADNIYVVMGCFVKYDYVSAEPPSFEEVKKLLEKFNKNSNKILFYALGGSKLSRTNIQNTIPQNLFKDIIFGNTYNYFIKEKENMFNPNYEKLNEISVLSSSIIKQIKRPMIIEIETATGCNRNPGCTFCIEGMRGLPLQFRKEEDIINEIKALYDNGARYFRLGRQPNFYAYMNNSSEHIEKLLKGIWEKCPQIETLHIDNVGPQDVNTEEGEKITKIIAKYCTDANITPFGIESFDPIIREQCNLNGSIEDIYKAIEIINKYGKEKGKTGMPKLLPGINIIYGLDGQTNKTLDINLTSFKKILNSGNWIRRVFVRKLTSPYGEQFDKYTDKDLKEFSDWQKQIENQFVIPMLKEMYPIGTEISKLRMEMYNNGDSILRQMATCPIRVVIKNKKLILDQFYKIRVIGYVENRTLLGEII